MRDDERAQVVERLRLFEAYGRALKQRHEVLDVLAEVTDDNEARQRLGELLDCGPVEAAAVFNLQLRRFRGGRNLIAQELAELRRVVAQFDGDSPAL